MADDKYQDPLRKALALSGRLLTSCSRSAKIAEMTDADAHAACVALACFTHMIDPIVDRLVGEKRDE